MADALVYVVVVVLFGVPVVLFGLLIRHFVPLMREFRAPGLAGILGPFAFADRFLSENARQHRTKCLAYGIAFAGWVAGLMVIFGAAK